LIVRPVAMFKVVAPFEQKRSFFEENPVVWGDRSCGSGQKCVQRSRLLAKALPEWDLR